MLLLYQTPRFGDIHSDFEAAWRGHELAYRVGRPELAVRDSLSHHPNRLEEPSTQIVGTVLGAKFVEEVVADMRGKWFSSESWKIAAKVGP